MSRSFGLHIGNSSSCLAVTKDGRCEAVANAAGNRVTPAAVGWNEGEVLLANSAKQFAAANPRKVILRGNRTLLGRTNQDEAVQHFASDSGKDSALILTDSNVPAYDIEVSEGKKKRITAQEVYTHILKDMKNIAMAHSSSEEAELNTVLTVPWDFTDTQREIVKKCAESVGYRILQIISEPASACLAYGLGQQDTHGAPIYCVIYRVGGTSLTVSLVRISSGFISVVKTIERFIGGEKITKIVADYMADEFQRKYKVDPRETKRGKNKLILNGENMKHVLSTLDTGNCYIESLYDGIDFNCNMTRARFENELGKVLTEYISPIHNLLSECDIKAESIEKVVICGGSAKIPRIQKSISGIFSQAEILNSVSPDEVLAIGAAAQAGLLSEPLKCQESRPQLRALNFEMLYQIEGDDHIHHLIPLSTPIPVRKHHHVDVKNPSVTVIVTLKAKDESVQTLSKLTLNELDSGSCKVSISAHIHRDGSLHLALTDKASGKIDQINLNNEPE